MLVLRRKVNETIVVDGAIIVHILAIQGDRIKVGITAPPETSIVRGELLAASKVETPSPPEMAPEPQKEVRRRPPRSRRWRARP